MFTYVSHEGMRHTVEIVYLVELVGSAGDLRLSEAHDDSKWIYPEEMDALQVGDKIRENVLEGFKVFSQE